MPLVDHSLQARELGHSSNTNVAPPLGQSYTVGALDDKSDRAYSSHEPYDETIYDEFYEMDDQDMMTPSAHKAQSPSEAVPVLPQKSALRASRLLDNLGLKMGGSLEAAETGRITPHDMYLSSEEDASSFADDLSDYEYDSSTDSYSHYSPSRRSSHEDTAKIVSVVFSGKPSIVDLSARRRSISPTSSGTRERSSTFSSTKSPIERSATPSSSVSSLHQSSRKSSQLVDVTGKKPPFLRIDPYANGSTYSLELSKENTKSPEESPLKQPKTSGTQLVKGLTRTFSLVKKRSRPLLNTFAATNAQPSQDSTTSPERSSARPESVVEEETVSERPQSPTSPPVTYEDILKAAKKNSMMFPKTTATKTQQKMQSPISPPPPMSPTGTGPKRGILSGLAARRRSIKLTGKVN